MDDVTKGEAQSSLSGAPGTDEMLQTKDRFFGHGVVRDPYPRLAEMLAACPVHPGVMPEYFDTVGPETLLFPGQQQYSAFSFKAVEAVSYTHLTLPTILRV